MKWLNKLRNKGIVKNRKVTRARFLYLYIIFGSIAGFSYLMVALVLDLPKHFALTPVYLLVLFIAYRFLVKNWSMIWLFVRDTEQGRLLLYLNESTHWEDEHKMKVINWILLRRNRVRKETHAAISAKIMDGTGITKGEAIKFKYKSVYCPQQILDGFNEALLVNALIYTHQNIQVLDGELRDIMNLSDDHMLKFDLYKEFEKAGGNEYNKYMEIGLKQSQKQN